MEKSKHSERYRLPLAFLDQKISMGQIYQPVMRHQFERAGWGETTMATAR